MQTEADAMMDRQRKEIMPNLTTPSKTSLPRYNQEKVGFKFSERKEICMHIATLFSSFKI